ncbi:hypothetical protein PG996_001791 [Apiospora saccharicola]|uniref:AB hydrolase-1 domain-containing protein n=1 Tax=Apiospora saccharicola TaxID=335842 RepID=A0ABR1WHN7_9PEZI
MPHPRNPLTLGGAAFLLTATLVSRPALARNCQNLTIPVHITAANTDLGDDFPTPQNDVEFTDFFLSNQPHGRLPPVMTTTSPPKTRNVTGDYELAATNCEPSSLGNSSSSSSSSNERIPKVLQVLTHGIGFDRSYRDFAFHDFEYSYVNHALDHGYATLAWDRLGLGESTRLDPVREVQLPLEVEALRELTRLLRAGSVDLEPDDPQAAAAANNGTTTHHFDKIVHVGHSLGSSVVYALAAVDMTALDGIAGPKGGHLAGYDPGYVVVGDVTALHTDFFAPGAYDPDILEPAYAATQPTTVDEIATGSYMANTKLDVTVPSLVITGRKCDSIHLLKLVSANFPLVDHNNTSIITVNGSGHGLNLDTNHESTYGNISDFLMSHGLSP